MLFARRPNGLGPLQPMRSNGKVLDFEEADPDEDVFGIGKIEDLSWKGMLDLATCTECGRCQSQCPAWATGKPLSPKMIILELRDHAFAKAPYLLAGSDEARAALPDAVKAEAERPIIGDEEAHGVIHPDELWSCTNCGACVEECPVDIEHIDHITGMRRHQVLVESAFPTEAGTMLRNLENKGNPWGMGENKRTEWITELDFEVPVVDGPIGDDVEYLFWVGCAGALEDRAKKTTKAIAQLLHTAGVNFAVLGPAESCTGDPARRMGNEFVFSMLAQQNIETLNEAGARKIVASCPHCFNTISREYPQLGGNYEVIHHTQLLAQLVADGKITPVTPIEEKITYHDPCFLGRHNRVFTPPREIMEQVPGVQAQEMHRCKERGFCCGAGGARMWMEERIGKRINTERIDEALGTDPDTISTGCPFCLVMLGDAVAAKKGSGEAKESLEVVDVAQLLIRSCRCRAVSQAVRKTRREWTPGGLSRSATASSPSRSPSWSSTCCRSRTRPRTDVHARPRGTLGDHYWPAYLAYVVSFLTIGIMWLNHHTMLAQVTKVDRPVLVLNLFLLMGIVAIPFPTALVADHLTGSGGRGRSGHGGRRYLRPGHDRDLDRVCVHVDLPGRAPGGARRPPPGAPAAAFDVQVHGGNAGYVAGTLIALVSPVAALIIFGLLAVYYMFEHLPSEPVEEPTASDAAVEAASYGTILTGSQTRTLVP